MLLYVCEEQFTYSLLCWCQRVVFFLFFLNKEDTKCHATQHGNTTIWNGQPQESGLTNYGDSSPDSHSSPLPRDPDETRDPKQ